MRKLRPQRMLVPQSKQSPTTTCCQMGSVARWAVVARAWLIGYLCLGIRCQAIKYEPLPVYAYIVNIYITWFTTELATPLSWPLHPTPPFQTIVISPPLLKLIQTTQNRSSDLFVQPLGMSLHYGLSSGRYHRAVNPSDAALMNPHFPLRRVPPLLPHPSRP